MPNWTNEQREVIQLPASARTLVGAGPGTGKTAVACARIAYLIDVLNVDPVSIWLVSFTRTAVHELRSRIGEYLKNKADVNAIRVATIDSHAWAIHSGFSQEAKLSGSYEENIERVIELLQSKEGVFEYLSSVQHLFVDEAQDVVGSRCTLMLEIIHALSRSCGVTVLADEAQSIYGFAEDVSEVGTHETLPEAIRKYFDDFLPMELTEIHRTSDRVLCRIFKEGRQIVCCKNPGIENLAQIRQMIGDTNHGDIGHFREDIQSLEGLRDDCFLLFRRRGEALEASSYFGSNPHRLRMSGLPNIIEPWVALIFWDWTNARMEKAEFVRRWSKLTAVATSADETWNTLVRFFGISENQISVEKLATRLGGGSPPLEFCRADFGFSGPVIGTIHGVKGREADEVRLYLPRMQTDQNNPGIMSGEEARIVFVGATRARKGLKVGHGATQAVPRRVEGSGRAFTSRAYRGQGSASVEIGRQGDVDATGLVGKVFFPTYDDAEWAQESLQRLEGEIYLDALAERASRLLDFRYGLQLEKNLDPVCYLSQQVNHDMFKIAELVGKRTPPQHINHLRIFGIRSFVLKPDDPSRERLHSPWSESGFILAPLVLGYSTVYFG